MPDLSKGSSSNQQLSTGVKFEYIMPTETDQTSQSNNAEVNTNSLADLMSKLKSL